MKLRRLFLYVIVILSVGLTFSSCEKDIDPQVKTPLAHKVNKFTHDLYKDVYLWSDDIPALNPLGDDDEQEFFKKMIHADDQWSVLTDDIASMRESFSGTGLTYGCSYFLTYVDDTRIIGVVKYVFADSPAENAGLKRGDIITKMNGSYIVESNYLDLYYSSSITLGFAEYKNDKLSDIDRTVDMTAIKMTEDPILEAKVFDTGAEKVGYIHYTSYLLNSHTDLNNVFNDFKAEGVTQVILDLRYNGGGYALTSLFLSSLLTTKNALTNEEIALKEIWNSSYNTSFAEKGIKKEERFTSEVKYKSSDGVDVVDEITGNLGLSKLYVLVSSGSASASESTIASLELYLDITLIGTKTSGKFCGGILFDPSDLYKTPDPDIDNWGSYTMIYRFANKNGETNAIGGYTPQHIVKEDILDLYPIGSEEDPQIAKALELITGVPTPASLKSVSVRSESKLIQHSRNMLDGKLIHLR